MPIFWYGVKALYRFTGVSCRNHTRDAFSLISNFTFYKVKTGAKQSKNWVTDFTVFPICFQLYCLQFNLAATLLLFHLSDAFSLFFRETTLLLYSFSQLIQYLIKWYNYDSRSKWHNHIWEQTIMHLRQYTMYMMGAEIYGH